MFQLDDIREAHLKVKTGADFPKYIQDLKKLGVIRYETFVDNGRTVYFGSNGFRIESLPKYETLEISNTNMSERFVQYLKGHQQGGSDYPTFCKQAAETGVEKWAVDISQMTCTYYDKLGDQMLREYIPTV